MPLLASDVYPGKQIAPVSYAQSKKSAITFAKMDSTTSIRQTQNSASTLSPNPKNVKQHKITKINNDYTISNNFLGRGKLFIKVHSEKFV